MMVRIGNFLFHYRNGLFPVVYLLIFLNGPAVLADYRVALAIGLTLVAFGQTLRAVTVGLDYIIRGGRKRQVYAERLVCGGMFAHCRNPLYVGNYLIILGVGIASNSLLFLSIGLPFFFFAYWAIIAAEEAFLLNKFGGEFTEYCQKVNRIIPNFSGLTRTLDGMTFNWRRLITAEYGSAYIWQAAILLATLKNLWFASLYRNSSKTIGILWGALLLVTAAYLTARAFKKSGTLKPA